MHFALPTRSPQHRPATFMAQSGPRSNPRRQLYAVIFGFVVLILLLRKILDGDGRPAGAPNTVMVVVVNRTGHQSDYIDKVIENRREYAQAHGFTTGYGLFVRNITDYDLGSAPDGWARIPAIRHAMTEYPWSDYFWYLNQDAIIMNPALSLEEQITNPKRLNTLMQRDIPVVPPDSVIRTYKHIPPERIQFIISQDHDGLQPGSMIIRNGAWARFFLDAWYDPMFRFYNFQKAEQHALEHIVQWHPTILTKLALIPQRTFNSYPSVPGGEGSYIEGDFVVHLHECWKPERSCEKEFARYWEQRSTVV